MAGRVSFFCLAGFVATQGYLIPIVALPSLNWALWPSLPDLFGIVLVIIVVLSTVHRTRVSRFDRSIFTDLVWMLLFFALNFFLVTTAFSTTGEGVKFGGFSLILFAKYVVVYWAATHVSIDKDRMHILHIAALIAFLWLCVTTLADRLSLIELDNLTTHLPSAIAGKWGSIGLDSTVSNSHGGTTVVILVLAALVLGTARHRFTPYVEGTVFVLSLPTSLISGSRQGLVRILAFFATYMSRRFLRYFMLILVLLIPVVVYLFVSDSPLPYIDDPNVIQSLDRQRVLITDPFSNEGLSGRPDLWQSVLNTLNEDPIRWFIGYGIGNYVEFNNSAHNMLLQLLEDGGLIELVLVGVLWARIFGRIWRRRWEAWAMVSLTIGMLTSALTSAIFYPNLSTGWYLGLFFVAMHIVPSVSQSDVPVRSKQSTG